MWCESYLVDVNIYILDLFIDDVKSYFFEYLLLDDFIVVCCCLFRCLVCVNILKMLVDEF